MRLIGHLQNEASAKTLGDYLLSLDIRNLVEPDGEQWAVWVYSEDQIDAGREALAGFIANPSDNKFQKARKSAAAIAEREKEDTAKYQKRVRTADQIWVTGRFGTVTVTLIVLSVIVTLIDWRFPGLGNNFYISLRLSGFLDEVRQGQIWRLITPIFVHFNFMHIFFNMWVLRDEGMLIESRQGSKRLLALVIVLGIGSNLGQYIYSGPAFGGMSGVLYGLLGYIWLRGHTDPDSGLFVPPSTLAMMLIWFFLCLTEVIPGAANVCHAVGLVLGMIIGAFPLRPRPR